MEVIVFVFNELDFITNLFQYSGMNGVVTVVKNLVAITINHLRKLYRFWVFKARVKHITPPCSYWLMYGIDKIKWA